LFFSMQRISTLIPIILGTVIIFLATITVVRPIKLISEASKKVAGGDFSIQLPIKGNTEVSELTRNFNLMVKELSANEYLHKEFVSNVSHEFKTPITSLKGYAKLLKCEDLPDDKRQEYADIIISESERLSNLSSKLLKLSELENEIIRNKREQFSLDEQIRDAILLLQNEWEKKNLELDVDMEEVTFKGYKELMALVWINLISNAIKYSGQGDLLKITLRQTDKITIEIRDSGIGMTKEDAGKIFRRFYKADKSRNSTGTGLGLSIVKKIIELHDGTIYVDSEPGKGSKFVVELH
jgi:signal transduction histidine kinase